MLISLASQNWDDFDPSTLPPLPEAHERRLQAVSSLLKRAVFIESLSREASSRR